VFLLFGEAEELLNLIVVVEANHEHGIVMVVVDHIRHTDTTASEEGNGMVHVVPTNDRVVWQVEGLLGSHEVERVVGLPVLFVVADDDPNLVERVETDVEGVLHGCVLCVLVRFHPRVVCSRIQRL